MTSGTSKPPKNFLRQTLERCFEIDLRALAWLRILVGATLVYDLIGRALDYHFLYSDGGALPRSLAISELGRRTGMSFHLMSGEGWFQSALFLAAFLAACCLIVGYGTRFVTVASWALFTSICSRNPLAMNAGDALMHMMLLWACFLPWGARHSVDASKRPPEAQRIPPAPTSNGAVASVASAAALIQVACMYFTTSLLKNGGDWDRGTAIYYALSVDQFVTPAGRALLRYPDLLEFLTRSTLMLEFYGPFLLLCPFHKKFVRTAAVGCFISLHLGIMMTMKLGFLPFLDIAVLLLFLPREIWDLIYRRRERSAVPAPEPAAPCGAVRAREAFAQAVAGTLLLYTLWWSLGTLGERLRPPAPLRNAAATIKLNETWGMFAPQPSKKDGWFVMTAELSDGRTIDLLRGGKPVDWSKPGDPGSLFLNYRHRKYMMALLRKGTSKKLIGRFVHHHWKDWNGRLSGQGVRVGEVRFYFMEERTPPPGRKEGGVRKRLIWTRKG